MKQSIVEVFIYIKPKEKLEILASMANKLDQFSGVVNATVNPYVKQLLSVKYDPAHTNGKALLSAVRQQGSDGVLVGI